MEKPRMLKRDAMTSASYTSAPSTGSANCDTMTAACVSELMNAATSIHKLHLKVKGTGSYAAHKALNELYDALPGHADDLAEGYQGAAEKLLDYKEAAPRTLNTVEEGIAYLRDMYQMINALQAKMPYSEIVNSLDTVKDTINSGKYKLLFLK
jgi:DNA-binding ferritin-like protein